MKLFMPMWVPYGGRGLSPCVQEQSRDVYRFSPVSILGRVPLTTSSLFAGVDDRYEGVVYFQVGSSGSKLSSVFTNSEFMDESMSRRTEYKDTLKQRKLVQRFGRVTPESLLEASLLRVKNRHQEMFATRVGQAMRNYFDLRDESTCNQEGGVYVSKREQVQLDALEKEILDEAGAVEVRDVIKKLGLVLPDENLFDRARTGRLDLHKSESGRLFYVVRGNNVEEHHY